MKVSIITVVYNGVSTIEQTIKSVLLQDYSDIEYIIIDGGSSDGTQDIIRKYEDKIAFWSSEPDNGIYDAMNKGLKISTGDVVGIINSDDWYDEGIIKNVVKCFEDTHTNVLYGSVVNVYENEKMENWIEKPIETMCFQMAIPHPSVFVKKSIYDKYGLFDIKYKLAADYELLLRFYNNKVSFYNMHQIIAYFRIGGASEKDKELCYEESYDISLRYASKDKNALQIKNIIQEKHKLYDFFATSGNSLSLKQMISKEIDMKIEKVVIFGAGIYGRVCYQLLQKEAVRVLSFIDNDKKKWGKYICGIPVCSPDCLKNIEDVTVIIIASELYTTDIICQIWAMKNEKLIYISLKYLMDNMDTN